MPTRVVTLALLAATLLLGGCRKKSAPEYYKLESTWSIMTSRDGDDAYADPTMDQVVAGLQAVPEEAVEGPKAADLLAKISAERARLAAEKAEAARIEAAAAVAREHIVFPTNDPAPTPPPAADAPPTAPAAVADAGVTRPFKGMTLAEFQKAFGSCTDSAGDVDVPGVGAMQGLSVQDASSCRRRLGVPEDVRYVYLFKDGKLAMERTERPQPVVDAGPPPPPRDAGPAFQLYFPGQPMPE